MRSDEVQVELVGALHDLRFHRGSPVPHLDAHRVAGPRG